MSRTVSEIAELVRHAMESLDLAPMADVFAPDAVYEIPFAPPGMPRRVEGREKILAMFASAGERARAHGIARTEVSVHETAGGFVVELIAEGRSPGGDAFRFPSSVGLLSVAGGQITSYRDYPNYAGAAAAMGVKSPAHAVFERFLAASVENRWDDLADCYAEDVVIEMPFTPAGVPRLTRGREELRRRFAAAARVRKMVKAENVVVHETADPAVVVAEFDLHGEMGGEEFVASYVMVVTVRDGEIVYSRDYADTAAAAERIARFRES